MKYSLFFDEILNGVSTSGNPCCAIFPIISASLADFCDALNNNGIASKKEITGLSDIVVIVNKLSTQQLSIERIESVPNQVNRLNR